MSALLEVEHLNVHIPLAAGLLHPVRDVSFSVKRGEMLCIVGESGCGKSLTSLALMDLLPKHSRREAHKLAFDGIDLLRLRERAMADLRGNGFLGFGVFRVWDPAQSQETVTEFGYNRTKVGTRYP